MATVATRASHLVLLNIAFLQTICCYLWSIQAVQNYFIVVRGLLLNWPRYIHSHQSVVKVFQIYYTLLFLHISSCGRSPKRKQLNVRNRQIASHLLLSGVAHLRYSLLPPSTPQCGVHTFSRNHFLHLIACANASDWVPPPINRKSHSQSVVSFARIPSCIS